MKKNGSLLVGAVALLLIPGVVRAYQNHVADKAHARWVTDLAKASAKAKKEHKLLIVDYSASWCEGCQDYKRKLFPTPKFAKETKDIILVDIDVDKQPNLAEKMEVSALPDIRFILPSGKQAGRILGYDEQGFYGLLGDAKKALKTGK